MKVLFTFCVILAFCVLSAQCGFTISSKSSRESIYALQLLLKHRDFQIGTDGIYGSGTAAVVRSFRSSIGYTAGDSSGDSVSLALMGYLQALVRPNDYTFAAEAAKQLLGTSDFSYRFDSTSVAAAKQFQARNNLVVDGYVGDNTWTALFEASNGESTNTGITGIGFNSKGQPTSVSSKCVELVKVFEGYESHAYQDSVGVWTIGYGHTKGVKPGDVISQATGEIYLEQDLNQAAGDVNRFVDVPLTQDQYDALTSFVFNLGGGALSNPSYGISTALRNRNYDYVPNELSRWVNAGGERLAGLVARRCSEGYLWDTGIVERNVPTSQCASYP